MIQQKLIIPLISFFVVWTLFSPSTFAVEQNPQYIFVRKTNTCSGSFCWNGIYPENYSAASIQEVVSTLGTAGRENRRLGIAALFHYFIGGTPETMSASLKNLTKVAQEQGVSILFAFDGFQWQTTRPDLWNWWDPSKPGYNPDNINNVEWTCWTSSCATKKAWRNWGAEMEVSPQPNIASPAVINANVEALKRYLPIVRDWYNALPSDKKYLFGGVVIGTEDDIGGNYYYYPNGVSNGGGIASSVQLGYAAVKTAGIKSSGSLTQSDLTTVLNNYMTALTKTAYDLGIPRDKIFTHVGGGDLEPQSFSTQLVYPSSAAALTSYSQPGWSFYHLASQPTASSVLSSNLNSIAATTWASPEWRYLGSDYDGWVRTLRDTLGYRNNAFLDVANWNDVQKNPDIIRAIRDVLNEVPSCWTSAPTITNFSLSGNTLSISWLPGQNNEQDYLNISTSPETNTLGTFINANIHNSRVTGLNTKTQQVTDPNARYYALIAGDGCSQRKIAYASTAVIPTATPVPPSPTTNPCPKKSLGDADCNNLIDLADFAIWKKEYIGKLTTHLSDFTNNSTVGLEDFAVWKKGFISQ